MRCILSDADSLELYELVTQKSDGIVQYEEKEKYYGNDGNKTRRQGEKSYVAVFFPEKHKAIVYRVLYKAVNPANPLPIELHDGIRAVRVNIRVRTMLDLVAVRLHPESDFLIFGIVGFFIITQVVKDFLAEDRKRASHRAISFYRGASGNELGLTSQPSRE